MREHSAENLDSKKLLTRCECSRILMSFKSCLLKFYLFFASRLESEVSAGKSYAKGEFYEVIVSHFALRLVLARSSSSE